MPTDLKIRVRSNVDALSASALRAALATMVRETVTGGKEFLRADRAKHSRTGATVAHIESDKLGELSSRFGITPVTEKDARRTSGEYKHSQAPLFVDGGTHSPIFSPHGNLMWNRAEGIFGRHSVRGQKPQHFVAKTVAETQTLLRENKSIGLALDAMNANAAAQKAAIEAE